ncbi:SipW-dependent-type signal peptide-containing protein [Agromyces sp. NPDC058110]|uniref:SipW-dependent-type signal peptide-containing protein n=1 Tax=Agromyces sp. NPDC058110 TaxID=3346345 RepID=UPI0036D8FD24
MSQDSSNAPSTRRRKILAILAGGLVLGVGTALTLAAWNDSEFATGTFTAGSFNLEGSTDGTTFEEHETAGAAAPLTFSLGFDALAPGDVVTAPFAVQLDADTDYDAVVSLLTPTVTGVAGGLQYRVVQTAAFGCDAISTPPDTVLLTPRALDAPTSDPTFALTGAENPAYFCFEVTALDTLAQNQSATATWEFAAESQ